MTSTVRTRTRRSLAAAAFVAALALATSSCGVVEDVGSAASGLVGGDASAQEAEAPAAPDPIESDLTSDGTVAAHLGVRGVDDLDVVLTMYPTARTPRTHEWHPRGGKFFTVTLQAFDTARGERDPFASKREVYLDRVRVTSGVIGRDGEERSGGRQPYRLDALARRVTLDPEPLATADGMLITSPKGSFELQDQRLGSVPRGTRGIVLRLRGVVHVETAAGSDDFVRRTVTAEVPVGIFDSARSTASERPQSS